MGIITGLIKLTGKLAGEGAEMYMKQSIQGIKQAAKANEWTFTQKIAELKTDKGLCQDYVKDLIQKSSDTKSLRVIYQYLKSDRNDLPSNVTKQFIQQLNEKAKWIQYNDGIKKIVDSKPNPFAFLDDHAHVIHDTLHHITEWMV